MTCIFVIKLGLCVHTCIAQRTVMLFVVWIQKFNVNYQNRREKAYWPNRNSGATKEMKSSVQVHLLVYFGKV